jgi:hypothetical protein
VRKGKRPVKLGRSADAVAGNALFGGTALQHLHHRIAQEEEKRRIGNRQDTEPFGARHALRGHHPVAQVLDAVPMVLAWSLEQCLFIGLQDHVHGNVANGMRTDAHAERVVELDGLVQLVLFDADQPLVVVIVAGNGLAEGSVLPREPAVDAHLDPTNLQPLRAEAVHKT